MSEGVQESGAFATINLLDATTLTATFADNESEAYCVSPHSQIELALDYTMNALEVDAKCVVKLLLSEDGTDYHEYSIAADQAVSGGVVKAILYPRRFEIDGVTGGTKETRWYAVPTAAKYFKILANEENAGAGFGILTAKARISDALRML